jgi:hypothetical protein
MLKTHERPRHRLVDPDVAHRADLPASPRFGLAAQTPAHGVGGVGFGFGLNRSMSHDPHIAQGLGLSRQPSAGPVATAAFPQRVGATPLTAHMPPAGSAVEMSGMA